MPSIIGIIGIIVGVILLVISFFTFKRDDENEISKDFMVSPFFIIGAIVLVVSIVLTIIAFA